MGDLVKRMVVGKYHAGDPPELVEAGTVVEVSKSLADSFDGVLVALTVSDEEVVGEIIDPPKEGGGEGAGLKSGEVKPGEGETVFTAEDFMFSKDITQNGKFRYKRNDGSLAHFGVFDEEGCEKFEEKMEASAEEYGLQIQIDDHTGAVPV